MKLSPFILIILWFGCYMSLWTDLNALSLNVLVRCDFQKFQLAREHILWFGFMFILITMKKTSQQEQRKLSFFVYFFLSSISSSMNRFSAMPGNDNDPDRKPWWVSFLFFSMIFNWFFISRQSGNLSILVSFFS